MNRSCLLLILVTLGLVTDHTVCAQAPKLVGIEYGTTVVLKKKESQSLIVVGATADPVLFTSKVYLFAWRFDSIKQLNEYLSASTDSIGIPKIVDQSKLSQHVVVLPNRTYFEVSDFRIGCLANDSHCGYLDVKFLGDDVKLAVVKLWQIKPPFHDRDLLSVDEYNKQFEKRRALALRARRENR